MTCHAPAGRALRERADALIKRLESEELDAVERAKLQKELKEVEKKLSAGGERT